MTMPIDPEATGRAGPAGVEEGLPDGDQPPGEDREVERQQRAEHGRGDRPGRQSGGRLGPDDDQRDREEDEGGDEEPEGQAAAAVERLAESREDGRQSGRGEAAKVGRSGVRPDPAGVHAGSGSSGWGRSSPRGRTRV